MAAEAFFPCTCHRCGRFTDDDLEMLRHYKQLAAARGYRLPSDLLAQFTRQEVAVLRTLARNVGEWVSSQALGQALGGLDREGVTQNVWRIRRSLPAGYRVENAAGVGYRLVVEG